jgi:hypothetical protein
VRTRRRLPAALAVVAVVLAAAPAGGQPESKAAPLGSDFRISGVLATALDSQPAAAWNGEADEYLVVWQDQRQLSTRGVEIAAQRVSAAGAPWG